MAQTYAVAWRVDHGPICVGELELGDDVELGGVDREGRGVALRVARGEIAAVRAASTGERLRGRRTFVLVCRGGGLVAVASLDRPGTALELSERLASA